jgi:hypothetical protein
MAARAQRQRVVFRERALAGQRRHDRDAQSFGKALELRPGAGLKHAAAHHQHWRLRIPNGADHRFYVGLGRRGSADGHGRIGIHAARRLGFHQVVRDLHDHRSPIPERSAPKARDIMSAARCGWLTSMVAWPPAASLRRTQSSGPARVVAVVAARDEEDRNRIRESLRDSAERGLGAWPILHARDPERPAGAHPAEAVGDVDGDPLGPRHDRAGFLPPRRCRRPD